MIVHFAPGGRLGNQLFELAFLDQMRKPSEWILSTNLGGAKRCLRCRRRHANSDLLAVTLLVDKVIRPLFRRPLSALRVVSSCFEQPDGTLVRRRGILPVLYVEGYFQDAAIPENGSCSVRLRAKHLKAARSILAEAGPRTPLFVHVRRTDYLNYKIKGTVDPSLPLSYYAEAIRLLARSAQAPFFFFLGDDPEWAAQAFPTLPQASPGRHPVEVDLALMSLCDGGVVSNSTFAWWGAFLCRGRGPIVAPRYWLGWRSSCWYPPRIMTRRFLYVDVRQDDGGERAAHGQ